MLPPFTRLMTAAWHRAAGRADDDQVTATHLLQGLRLRDGCGSRPRPRRDPPTIEWWFAAFREQERTNPSAVMSPAVEALLALGAEDDYFDTGHLLLALLRHGLAELTITADEAAAEIRQRMAEFLTGRVPPMDPARADELIDQPRAWVPADIRALGVRLADVHRVRSTPRTSNGPPLSEDRRRNCSRPGPSWWRRGRRNWTCWPPWRNWKPCEPRSTDSATADSPLTTSPGRPLRPPV